MSGAGRPDIVRDALGADLAPDARESWLEDAADTFRRNGVLIIRNAIPLPQIAAARKALEAREGAVDGADNRPFQPAPLRPPIAVPLAGPFADPAVFAPPSVLPLARRLLGPEMIVGELGAVVSRPGDGPREMRRAAVPLFGGLDVERDVPPAALTMLAPLGDVGSGMGFPEYWLGSHRLGAAGTTASPYQPDFEAGSVVMCDWRVLYRAGANTSGATAHALYVSFQRKWLLSLSGSEYRQGLSVPAATLRRLPEAYHPLVTWALHLNKTDDVSEFIHLWMGRAVRRLRTLRRGRT